MWRKSRNQPLDEDKFFASFFADKQFRKIPAAGNIPADHKFIFLVEAVLAPGIRFLSGNIDRIRALRDDPFDRSGWC
jgi:hypothetical protein